MLKLTFRLIHAVEVLFILKGIVHKKKKKVLSSFTLPQVVPNLI